VSLELEQLSQHISGQFNADLESLRTGLLSMGGWVEQQVGHAVTALLEADSALADEVRTRDGHMAQMEQQIDAQCLRILARRQPAASDLRLVICISKAVIDLRRMGVEASKIAKRALVLSEEGRAPRGYIELRHIGGQVRQMVAQALDAFARLDGEKAGQVARQDSQIDREYKSALRELMTFMMEDPRSISRVFAIIWALRSLERIGDHARNLAEGVLLLLHGTKSLPDLPATTEA